MDNALKNRNQDDVDSHDTGSVPTDKVFTLANIITFARLGLIPIFFLLIINNPSGPLRGVAFAIFTIAAATDWVDGQIARRTNTVSKLGKFLDPIVDRALIFFAVVALFVIGDIPLWVMIVLIARDAFLAGIVVLTKGSVAKGFDVSLLGKTATFILLTGFAFALLGLPIISGIGLVNHPLLPGLGSEPAPLGIFIIYLGMVLSIITAFIYVMQARRDHRL